MCTCRYSLSRQYRQELSVDQSENAHVREADERSCDPRKQDRRTMNRSRNIRSRPTGFAKQSRHKKALFLPMDRAAADDLVLPVRIAYERIRMGKCDRGAVVYMAEIVLL